MQLGRRGWVVTLINLAEYDYAGEAGIGIVGDGGVVEEDFCSRLEWAIV
jgi:hypothetical protein